MAQTTTTITADPISQLYEIANTLRMMHEKLGEVYPELKHTWYLLERSLNECLEVLDAAAVDAALKKGA